MATVLAAWTGVIVAHARTHGHVVEPLLAKHGIELGALDIPGARIHARVDDLVWEELDRELGDPDLGVHLAERSVSTSNLGIVGFLARASRTVGEAIAQGERLHRLIKDDNHVAVVRGPRTATVVEMPGPDRGAWPRVVAEVILGNYVALARAWTGSPIVPVEVRFQHRRPRDTRELERFFGIRPRFDQPENALVLSDDVLALPLATAETPLLAFLESVAAAQHEALGAAGFGDEVRLSVDTLLAIDPSIDRVARRLAVSPRSLQRRLEAEGLTFRGVVDDTRLRRAIELVRAGETTTEIAAKLGFSDARAFRRAYRRWTGPPP